MMEQNPQLSQFWQPVVPIQQLATYASGVPVIALQGSLITTNSIAGVSNLNTSGVTGVTGLYLGDHHTLQGHQVMVTNSNHSQGTMVVSVDPNQSQIQIQQQQQQQQQQQLLQQQQALELYLVSSERRGEWDSLELYG